MGMARSGVDKRPAADNKDGEGWPDLQQAAFSGPATWRTNLKQSQLLCDKRATTSNTNGKNPARSSPLSCLTSSPTILCSWQNFSPQVSFLFALFCFPSWLVSVKCPPGFLLHFQKQDVTVMSWAWLLGCWGQIHWAHLSLLGCHQEGASYFPLFSSSPYTGSEKSADE